MSDEQSGSSLKPVSPARVAQELSRLHAMRLSGELNPGTYDQRFARIIQELRERRIEGTRAEVAAALQPLISKGAITQGECDRLLKQLGIQ